MICPFFAVAAIGSKQPNVPINCQKTNCAAWGQIEVRCVNPEARSYEHKYEPILGCMLCQPDTDGFYGAFDFAYPYNPSYENYCDSDMKVGENKEREYNCCLKCKHLKNIVNYCSVLGYIFEDDRILDTIYCDQYEEDKDHE